MPAPVQVPPYILSFDDIRAVLGVSSKELKDQTLALPVYVTWIESKLEAVHIELPELYNSLVAKRKLNLEDPNNPALTQIERKIVGLTQTYATYLQARMALTNMQAGAMKRITDGKAEIERYQIDFTTLFDEIDMQLAGLLSALIAALEGYGLGFPIVRTTYPVRSTGLAIDPVTGEAQ